MKRQMEDWIVLKQNYQLGLVCNAYLISESQPDCQVLIVDL